MTTFSKIDRRAFMLGVGSTAGLMGVGGGLPGGTNFVRLAHAEQPSQKTKATIAVAASLRFAFEDAVAVWRDKNASNAIGDVQLVFGATSTLVRQIENGAQFDAFFSADRRSPTRLFERNLTSAAPDVFALGRLALVSHKSSGIAVDKAFAGLKAATTSGHLKRLAIANPELAPYGLAAQQALKHVGLWRDVEKRLAVGENVGQAAQFALSGAAQAGLIALSLAGVAKLSDALNVAVVRDDWHDPIEHTMVRQKTVSPVADAFYAFASSELMTEVLARHGLKKPIVASGSRS
jgi:molybdate transport system substrate-binding protein